MGKIKFPERALPFVGALYSDPGVFGHSKKILEKDFGNILFESAALPWGYSSYYRDELGWPIKRRFIFFKDFIDPGTLADIKIKTNEIEDTLSLNDKRRINLDPGYLTLAKIVLASTKNYAHRIYLGRGIYGEVTLVYKDNIYTPHLFTYKDYQDKAYINIFMNVREMLKKMLS